MLKNVKNYLKGYRVFLVAASVCLLFTVVIVILFVSDIINGKFKFNHTDYILVWAPIASIFLFWEGFQERKSLAAIIKNSDNQELLVNDFEQSQEVLNGQLRLGMKYIFGKHSNRLLKYEDISQAYIYVHKTNGIENERKLRVIDSHQQTIDLCKLKARGKNMDELESVINYLLTRNPEIKIGYR